MGKYPLLMSFMFKVTPVCFSNGINPSFTLSTGGDLDTSVPPIILTYC